MRDDSTGSGRRVLVIDDNPAIRAAEHKEDAVAQRTFDIQLDAANSTVGPAGEVRSSGGYSDERARRRTALLRRACRQSIDWERAGVPVVPAAGRTSFTDTLRLRKLNACLPSQAAGRGNGAAR